VGEDLELSRAPFWQISAFRRIGESRSRLGLGLDIAAFESSVRTVFMGVPGNERSQEVFGVAAVWDFMVADMHRSRWRVGAGVKIADWKDTNNFLLDEFGNQVIGSSNELGGLFKAEAVFNPRSRFPILAGFDQLYWPDIDLGEFRVRVGLQIVP
jgi:hypothetical protein